MASGMWNGIRVCCGAAAFAVAGAVCAADTTASQDTGTVLRSELKELLTRLAASGALDSAGGPDAALAVSAPPVRVVTLGAVLDTAGSGRDGVAVLAVTPGGNAAALGLRAGDAVRAVNGESLLGMPGSEAAQHLRRAVESGDGHVRLEVNRAGRAVALDGAVRPVLVPGYRFELAGGSAPGLNAGIAAATMANSADSGGGACGRVSEFPVAPRALKLYGVKILLVDGHNAGPRSQQNFRLPVGTHEVTMAENIDYRDLPIVHNRERRGSEKTLRVEVKADTTTILAARLSEASAASGKGYWEPAVWKDIPEPCR
jgi:hypothetical protein